MYNGQMRTQDCLEAGKGVCVCVCGYGCARVRVRTLTLVSRWPRGDRKYVYIYIYIYMRIHYPLDVSPSQKSTNMVSTPQGSSNESGMF